VAGLNSLTILDYRRDRLPEYLPDGVQGTSLAP
jgi:hypothetical protein